MDCHLILIHVPETVTIMQGADGLSRGVPLQSLYKHEGNLLLLLLQRAAIPSRNLLEWVLQKILFGNPNQNGSFIQITQIGPEA